ncbi:mechanosensitive ion channel domain-containing protein [Longispora albida]|uniref:mechanosensitive ion channel domain-containing protein n=1 Tax=Longispora albida TaxID=203523 RepID=UPI00036E7094|nr:mechanosensitive ion channel domain-containing protein [Longispora albida]
MTFAPLTSHARRAFRNLWRPLALVSAALAVAVLVPAWGDSRSGRIADKLLAVGGALVFLMTAMTATFAIASRVRRLAEVALGGAHAGVLRLIVVLTGGLVTLLTTLGLLSVPIGQLLLGGALTGVIVGIAGQQTLANLFAGIVLLVARPFRVGQVVRLSSGALGGDFDGTVTEIGLAYVRLEAEQGTLAVPNSQVLNAVVSPQPGPSTAPGGALWSRIRHYRRSPPPAGTSR